MQETTILTLKKEIEGCHDLHPPPHRQRLVFSKPGKWFCLISYHFYIWIMKSAWWLPFNVRRTADRRGGLFCGSSYWELQLIVIKKNKQNSLLQQ